MAISRKPVVMDEYLLRAIFARTSNIHSERIVNFLLAHGFLMEDDGCIYRTEKLAEFRRNILMLLQAELDLVKDI